MNVAYITSLYPSLSHSFILREVRPSGPRA